MLGVVDRNEDFAIHRYPRVRENGHTPSLSPGPVPSAGSVQLISTRGWGGLLWRSEYGRRRKNCQGDYEDGGTSCFPAASHTVIASTGHASHARSSRSRSTRVGSTNTARPSASS